MTQFADNLYLGAAPTNVSDGRFTTNGVGPMGRAFTYNVVPATLSATGLRTSSAQAGAGSVTLNGALVTGGIGTFDIPRAATITTTTDFTGTTFTFTGTDMYGQVMSQALAGPNNATVTTKKAFKTITSVSKTSGAAGSFSLGSSDTFGLPWMVTNLGDFIMCRWNATTTFALDASVVAAGDATSPATTSTGDTRGTVTPSTGASDGVKRLEVTWHLPVTAAGYSATLAGAIGVPQV